MPPSRTIPGKSSFIYGPLPVLDRMKEFYFGKNKLVMEWQGRKDRTAFLFSGLDSASGFAALPAVMGIART